ncbi:M56 family metallopeptidase [Spirosoma rhododendri]|uniref:M48 family metalloprotease n=1 Tax=Spirosoma rhododendri TaxID=2728024 RepID=A0A7L5DPY6_9BACT|nr:M56 family metallopeptidase [Spirosoma rhododendri]QJD78578.1 M48 family metalloprotease [Spirosoma rhododendri]
MTTIEFLNSPVVRALGWTLLHAVWQGFALVLPTAVTLYLLRRGSSNARYRLGLAVLAVQLLVSVATFAWYYQPATVASRSVPVTLTNLTIRLSAGTPSLSWSQQVLLFLDTHLSQFVCIYLAGLTLFGLRLAGGWLQLHQLRRSAVAAPLIQERTIVERLRVTLNVRARVLVRESAQVAGPLIIGALKPMLLLPVGLITGLSNRELEAVLAHELAHIKRYDYAVNLLQSIIEVLYFFHPALWWLSARVREEREHCCDDLAVQLCGDNGRALAQALARIEERRLEQTPVPTLAMAFAGRRQLLLHRVQRVLGLSTRSLVSNRSLAGLTLTTLLLISASVYAVQQPEKAQQPKPHVTVITKIDAPKPVIEAISPAISVVTASPKIRLSTNTVPAVASSNPVERPIGEVRDSIKIGNEWITIQTVDGSKIAMQDTSRLQRAQRQLEQLSNELTQIMADRQPMIDRISKEMEDLTLKNTGNQKFVQALQERQAKLAAQQATLASKQAVFAQKTVVLQAEIAKLSAQNSVKSRQLLNQKIRQQKQLEKQMDALGTQMGNLGGQMGDLGGQMADRVAPYQQRIEILADSINKLVEPTYAFTEKIAELSGIIAENANQQAEKAMEMANKALELNMNMPLELNVDARSPARRTPRKPALPKYRVHQGTIVRPVLPAAPAPVAVPPPAIEARPAAPARPATPPKAIKSRVTIPAPPAPPKE